MTKSFIFAIWKKKHFKQNEWKQKQIVGITTNKYCSWTALSWSKTTQNSEQSLQANMYLENYSLSASARSATSLDAGRRSQNLALISPLGNVFMSGTRFFTMFFFFFLLIPLGPSGRRGPTSRRSTSLPLFDRNEYRSHSSVITVFARTWEEL